MQDKSTQANHKVLMTEQESLDLTKILNLKYGSYLKERFFLINFHEEDSGIFASMTLRNQNRSFFYEVEARAASKDMAALKSREALFILLDYIDLYFAEYFKEEENSYISIDWSEQSFENLTFQMRGQVRDLNSELMADELLRKHNLKLEANTLQE